ncbi:hypothetical protein QPL78_01955 [Bacillus halotolerans]|uniref:hypothetical protein n=1 Tax=Bacillus halotolerans TaxID=260554 RepID=UPI00253F9757|nr:hypothetical protein [Bacillus halotolerans]WIG47344.1 hypothetical protein QPL78_01955 [Bacillus halotolerans]
MGERKEDLRITISLHDRTFESYSFNSLFNDNISESSKILSLSTIGWETDEYTEDINKTIDIYFSETQGRVSITGDNQEWVNGFIEVLKKFFSTKQFCMQSLNFSFL